MRNLITLIIIVSIGLATAVGFSVFAYGPDTTFRSIEFVTARLFNNISSTPSRETAVLDSEILAQSSLGNPGELSYGDINVVSVDPVEFRERPSPFLIPSKGIAAHKNFIYEPINHGGIDIWTRLDGKGVDGSTSKGYPVYAACSGLVIRVYQPNEEIEILCDEIKSAFKNVVPSLKVKTLYAHMGDAVNKTRYHSLKVGQRVTKGELIGYQGNVSSIVPVNRVTHLHFGIYDLTQPGRPTLDPEPYIGVPCTVVGQKFEVNLKK